MVIVNLEIAFTRHFKIKQPVTRKQIEHVIEKRQSGADLRPSTAIEVEDNTHICLFGLAMDCGDARLSFCFHVHNHPIDELNQTDPQAVGAGASPPSQPETPFAQ